MTAPPEVQFKPEDAMLPDNVAKRMRAGGLGALGVGAILAGIGLFTDAQRFAFSYLTGFTWMLTIGLGALIFIVIMQLTRTGWSVAAQRQAQWITGVIPYGVLLFIPLVVFAYKFHIWEWMSPEMAGDELLKKKMWWLTPNFFWGRAVLYFAVWLFLSRYFSRKSRRQDQTGDSRLTHDMQKMAAPGVLLMALTLTAAAFDWLMSLMPHWYSTIFGLYIFAGSLVAALALISLITIDLQRQGLFGKVSTVEHRHDLAKLMFGFTIFWTYMAFSQYFLIWYANIPEETIFFRARGEGSWMIISKLLVLGHFVFPFVVLLPRTTKRHMQILAAMAGWMLFMHYVDLYWIIMPVHSELGVGVSFANFMVDLGGVALPAGVLMFAISRRAASEPIFPVRDPRLAETMRLEQV